MARVLKLIEGDLEKGREYIPRFQENREQSEPIQVFYRPLSGSEYSEIRGRLIASQIEAEEGKRTSIRVPTMLAVLRQCITNVKGYYRLDENDNEVPVSLEEFHHIMKTIPSESELVLELFGEIYSSAGIGENKKKA